MKQTDYINTNITCDQLTPIVHIDKPEPSAKDRVSISFYHTAEAQELLSPEAFFLYMYFALYNDKDTVQFSAYEFCDFYGWTHEKYMDAFFKQLKEKLGEDSSFAVSLFQDLGDHMVTDCDVTTLSNLVKKYGDGELGQILSIKGENVLGEKYYEYYLDEDDLDRVIVDHLYEPKK